MMQRNIFETGNAETGLIIVKKQKTLLNKHQQTYNRLVKKIESLRIEIEQVKKSLNEKLDFYAKHLHPIELELTALIIEKTKLLYRFFKNPKLLSKKQKESLCKIIAGQLNFIFESGNGEPDDELKQIFKAIEGISYEEAANENFDSMKYEMESMFEEFGFKMNFDDLHSQMTEEDMIKKVAEMEAALKDGAQRNQNRFARKKTKKQLEKEQRDKQSVELRSKNISTIYRQLAKIFHPDLEQDEDLKLQKEELMKQLTIAYDSNNLHALLSLELKWIQKEENKPGNLTDEKLGIYNEVLKEQVLELQQEIGLILEHPRYHPLQKFALVAHEIININLRREKQQLEIAKKDTIADVKKLNGNEKQALSAVKEVIIDFEMQSHFDQDFSQFFW